MFIHASTFSECYGNPHADQGLTFLVKIIYDSTDHATPLYSQKLALTSPTSGGLSVGIVRSRTKATESVSLQCSCSYCLLHSVVIWSLGYSLVLILKPLTLTYSIVQIAAEPWPVLLQFVITETQDLLILGNVNNFASSVGVHIINGVSGCEPV
jgi:hypothetical protein